MKWNHAKIMSKYKALASKVLESIKMDFVTSKYHNINLLRGKDKKWKSLWDIIDKKLNNAYDIPL